MKKNNTVINTTAKIVIPKKSNSTTESRRKEILEDLASITDIDIENIWTELECKRIKKELENGTGHRLSQKDIDFLINNWHCIYLCENIWKVPLKYHKTIALSFINNCKPVFDLLGSDVRDKYLVNFKDSSIFDSDIALALIKWWYSYILIDNIDSFQLLDKKVAIELYKAKNKCLPIQKFSKSKRNDVALFYIENWVDIKLDGCIFIKEFANNILKLNNGHKFEILCKYIENFKQYDKEEIVSNIIIAGWAKILLNYIDSFQQTLLSKETAFSLFEHLDDNDDYWHINPAHFIEKDRKDIVLYILDHWHEPYLLNVPGLNLDFAKKIIERNKLDYLAQHIHHFQEEDHKEILISLLDAWYFNIVTLKRFKWKDKDCIMKLFQCAGDSRAKELAEYIAENPDEFWELDDEIANKLIDLWYGSKVKCFRNFYKDLKPRTKLRLITK